MTSVSLAHAEPPASPAALPRPSIEAAVRECPGLPALRSVDSALRQLLNSDQSHTGQISDLIRRDPSLTARLLRLVNSVYYGLSTQVKSIDEAVLYLGIRQIRQLAMVTPVLEDFQKLAGSIPFPWREFWRHCIAVATLTRELTSALSDPADDSGYVAGLVHDVGVIVMAASFPTHFSAIHHRVAAGGPSLSAVETECLGMDHAELGALYLRHHRLHAAMVEAALHHNQPELANDQRQIVAAVQIADLLVRQAKLGTNGDPAPVSEEMCAQASGWKILFPEKDPARRTAAKAALQRTLERLPLMLDGLV